MKRIVNSFFFCVSVIYLLTYLFEIKSYKRDPYNSAEYML